MTPAGRPLAHDDTHHGRALAERLRPWKWPAIRVVGIVVTIVVLIQSGAAEWVAILTAWAIAIGPEAGYRAGRKSLYPWYSQTDKASEQWIAAHQRYVEHSGLSPEAIGFLFRAGADWQHNRAAYGAQSNRASE